MVIIKIKSLSEIVSNLINTTTSLTSELTDFTLGSSIIRSIYEAFAMQLQEYYVLTRQNIKGGIEEGVQNGFGFERRKATQAFGDLLITFSSSTVADTIIPQGTTFTSNIQGYNYSYETIEPYFVPAGSIDAKVTVYCNTIGTSGNVPANVINAVQNSIGNVATITNPEEIITGQDEESESDFKNRFNQYITAIGRSTVQSIEYATRKVQNITGVYVDDSETGLIKVYCHDANGNLEENDYNKVVYAISNENDEYNPAGIAWEVLPVDKVLANMDINVYIKDFNKLTETVQNSIENIVNSYLNTKVVGSDVSLSQISRLIMNFDPYLITDVSVEIPITDDMDSKINSASSDVSSVSQERSTVSGLVSSAQYDNSYTATDMINYGNDYLITVNEKAELNKQLVSINSNYTTDSSLADKYFVNKFRYSQAYNNIVSLLTNILPTDNKPFQIDYTNYRETIMDYYASRVTLLNNIQGSISNKLTTLQQSLVSLNQEAYEQQHSNISIGPNQVARPGDDVNVFYYNTQDAEQTTVTKYIDQHTTEMTTIDESQE